MADTFPDSVQGVSYSYTYTKEDAEDVLQKVFLNDFSQDNILTVRSILSNGLFVWLLMIVIICIDLFGKEK